MLKLEIDVTEVPEDEAEDVTSILAGITASLQYYTRVKFTVTDGDQVDEAYSLGRSVES